MPPVTGATPPNDCRKRTACAVLCISRESLSSSRPDTALDDRPRTAWWDDSQLRAIEVADPVRALLR